MARLLENRIAFVTGGAGGIGAATAIAFAAEGAKVAVADLKDPEDTVRAIRDAGGEAYALSLDVTDQAAVDAAVDGVVAKWGRLDIALTMPACRWRTTRPPGNRSTCTTGSSP
jgi:NAD(P)-dependent dehydrogenase (short-subunit alcohol dehydrogenase family)